MKKIIILVLSLSFLTGCSATYNLEVYNNKVKEDMEYFDTNSENWYNSSNSNQSYRDLVESSVDYPYPAFDSAIVNEDDTIKLDDVEYYSNKIIDDGEKLGQSLSYKKFKVSNYGDSFIAKKCYKYFNVLDDGKQIIISTSPENTCFDQYPMLDDITINFKTNHKVISSNADSVKGYHYTWKISREEKNDASIQIILAKNKYVFNYENEFVKKIFYILLIVGIISIGGSVVYKHYKNKNKKLNEV